MIDEKMIEAAIRAEVSRRVDDLTKAARTAAKLEDALQTMKRLHGDKWEERAAPFRVIINDVSSLEGCSVLNAALMIAKGMVDIGESPIMLLAVAAEMCNAKP